MEPKFFNILKSRAVKKLEERVLKFVTFDFYLATQDIAIQKLDERFGLFDDDHTQGHMLLETSVSDLCEVKGIKIDEELLEIARSVHYLTAYELNSIQSYKSRALAFTDRLIELTDRIKHGQAQPLAAIKYINQFFKDFPQADSADLKKKREELEARNSFRGTVSLGDDWYPHWGSSIGLGGGGGTGSGG